MASLPLQVYACTTSKKGKVALFWLFELPLFDSVCYSFFFRTRNPPAVDDGRQIGLFFNPAT